MLRPALLFSGLLACTPGSPATKTEPTKTELTEAGPSAAECAPKVAAMRTLFADGPDDAFMINTLEGMQLPETSGGGVTTEAGLPVFIRADNSFDFNNQSFKTVAELQSTLTEEFNNARNLAEMTDQPSQPRLLLIADARAIASVIPELAAALPPTTSLALIATLAGDTVPTPPPTPAAVQAALAVPAELRSQKLAELLTTAIGSCTAVADVFQAVATTSPDMRSMLLLDALPGAVEHCRCEGIDVETVVSAVWSMSGKLGPNQRKLELRLARSREAATMIPANATFSDLVRLAEAPDAKPLRFAAAK